MEALLSACLGIGLSASCGFRVFVPLLAMSIAAAAGHLTLAPGFAWIGSGVALAAFAVATLLEVAAYAIPWLDNALDTIAAPAAVVAGVMVTASVAGDMSPLLRWSLAVIAGGGAAGAVQSVTVATRAASTATTGGLANPLLSTLELGGAITASVLALLAPVAAMFALAIGLTLLAYSLGRRGRGARHT